jgi:hypothetical protein
MKWILPALALCCSFGCITNDSPIRLLGAHPLKVSDTDCAAEDVQIISGRLDVSAQPSYLLQFDLESDMQRINTNTGGTSIADESRNNFYANEVILSYTSTPALTFEQESVPVHFVVEPGSPAIVRMNILTRKAYTVLSQNVLVPSDKLDLRLQLEFRGYLASGQKLRSNSIVYPISVFTSGFTGCPANTLLTRTGPCGSTGGQDGAPVICCPVDPADTTKCKS